MVLGQHMADTGRERPVMAKWIGGMIQSIAPQTIRQFRVDDRVGSASARKMRINVVDVDVQHAANTLLRGWRRDSRRHFIERSVPAVRAFMTRPGDGEESRPLLC